MTKDAIFFVIVITEFVFLGSALIMFALDLLK
jgi:hypothetical protein